MMRWTIVRISVLQLFLPLTPTPTFASPATSDFLNAMTACGLGITLNIDANLAGSVKSLYDGAETKGKGFLSIEPALRKMVQDADPAASAEAIARYTNCVQQTLSLK